MIPYHKWYSWIDKKIHEMKEENIRREKAEIIKIT